MHLVELHGLHKIILLQFLEMEMELRFVPSIGVLKTVNGFLAINGRSRYLERMKNSNLYISLGDL